MDYIQKRKQQMRNIDYKRRYGITSEVVDGMIEKQDGCCYICGDKPSNHKYTGLKVDHCHKTGEVRAMLCNGCNSGLGMFGDNIEAMKKAIEHLMENINETV